jgi:uncharacterized repeat protein (TIGR03803 family)
MTTPPMTVFGKRTFVFAILFSIGVLAAPLAHAQTFSVIHNFTGGSDGSSPLSGFVMVNGYLYGTASTGGGAGAGVVFKMSTTGEETVLHEFTGGSDGASPEGHLVFDKSGNFYGTTWAGGSANAGTVFKVTPAGVETVLFSFPVYGDGASPVAGLTIDAAGNLYGTTSVGGANSKGTVFKLSPPSGSGGTWTEQVLYNFGAGTDGANPFAGVTLDAAGNLYGTTSAGGTYSYGTVFELSPSGSGWKETILHEFELGSDGGVPYSGLVADGKGNFYGAATEGGGGGQSGGGTIFKLTKTDSRWKFAEFYGLSGWGISGSFRNLMVVGDTIYATTHCDGVNDAGTVYELTRSGNTWTYNSLYVFAGGTDGLYSISNLVADSKGNLYGVTLLGGANGDGVAFKVTP